MSPKVSEPVPAFDVLLRSAKISAVHLEMRDSYHVAEEAEDFAFWRAGDWTVERDLAKRKEWLDLVGETVGRGVAMRRARIVSTPVSEYIRFEHSGTPLNIDAGEQVRWLPRAEASDIALPGNDFWLIDGRAVRFNVFTGDGGWEEAAQQYTEEPDVAELCRTAFEKVWERGTPHEQFVI